jgi:glycosyltransferase involved in cell wall biosynthesis
MKIAFISTMDGVPWGGSEELWSQAATRLKDAGHEIQASVEYWPQLSDKITALRATGIKVQTHSRPRPRRLRRIWNRLSNSNHDGDGWLKEFNPNLVVLSQGYNAGGFAWAKVCREAAIPYVMIVHCNSELWWFQDRLADAVASYTTARSVFCVSRKNLDLLRLQVGEPLLNAQIVWNPYNVSPDDTPTWPDERAGLRLACVGRINMANKGQDMLLQTLARPEWQSRPIELNFFGTGPDEPALRRMAEILQVKHVRFRGHVSDVSSIWQQNHLLVLPSRCEGLPLVLVEAMWSGRPSVVTDIGGNAELCVDNETGFVAAAPEVIFVADALQRAWDRRQDWRRMGQAARARVENLVPRDPIGAFCEQLKACATRPSASTLSDGQRSLVTKSECGE